jgi:hypothetical protein
MTKEIILTEKEVEMLYNSKECVYSILEDGTRIKITTLKIIKDTYDGFKAYCC